MAKYSVETDYFKRNKSVDYKPMIRPRLHEIAAKHGVKNAYQFQKLTGFPNSMAYALWQKEWQLVHLNTLNTLCHVFKCTPNDLLEFARDPDFAHER